MAERLEAEPTAFFVGVLAADAACLATAEEALAAHFGQATETRPARPFRFTSYYENELGPTPLRAFYGFDTAFPPDLLAARKILTNELEGELAARLGMASPRPVNLDPGYLAPDKLVLASAKNFSHRIYLSGGIYAEITLQYRGGVFRALPWTFPDYASGEYDDFFLGLRDKLMRARKFRRTKDGNGHASGN